MAEKFQDEEFEGLNLSEDDSESFDNLDDEIKDLDNISPKGDAPESSENKGGPKKFQLDKRGKLMLAGGGIVLALAGVFGITHAISENNKKAQEAKQAATDQNAVQSSTNAENAQNGAQGLIDGNNSNAINNVACDLNNPNNPSNQNNPDCVGKLNTQQQLAGNGAVDPNTGQPVNNNGQTVADNSANQGQTQQSGYSDTGTSSGNQSYSSSDNGGGGSSSSASSTSAWTPKPKKEKELPQKPDNFQPREIQKPSFNSGNIGGGSGAGQKDTAAGNITTQGVQGQSQAQADATNAQQKGRIRPTNDTKKADGVNTFLLQTGSYIPLSIMTVINSDNPSYFMGLVRENVYTQDGKHRLLIPMGSKIIGNYKALASNTATRMFLFVEKIILPNQQVIAFQNENVVALNGEIGTRGKLNGRFWQRLGNTTLALTFSAADLALDYRRSKAAIRAADNNNNISSSTWEDLLGSPTSTIKGLGKGLSEAWQAPKNRIKVPIGSRLNVLVSNDLVLPEYRGR